MQNRSKSIKAIEIEYKGIHCHSLLEAKYIILIESEYSFLRHPLKIWYDPNSLMPVVNLGENPVYYQPDFLVRRWSDGQAFLVEIKDLERQDAHSKAVQSELIAQNFIKEKCFDWQFQLRSSIDIQASLSPAQIAYFMQEVRNKKEVFDAKRKFQKWDKQFRQTSTSKISSPMQGFIKGEPVNEIELKKYLWNGVLPERMQNN